MGIEHYHSVPRDAAALPLALWAPPIPRSCLSTRGVRHGHPLDVAVRPKQGGKTSAVPPAPRAAAASKEQGGEMRPAVLALPPTLAPQSLLPLQCSAMCVCL